MGIAFFPIRAGENDRPDDADYFLQRGEEGRYELVYHIMEGRIPLNFVLGSGPTLEETAQAYAATIEGGYVLFHHIQGSQYLPRWWRTTGFQAKDGVSVDQVVEFEGYLASALRQR